MGQLTTHVLDTAQGIPARQVRIVLYRIDRLDRTMITSAITNQDGRVDGPLLAGDSFTAGTYELVFDIDGYFRSQPVDVTTPPFLDVVTIRFTVSDAVSNHHIPLLVSPWAYSTYRGS
ncbi:MAG: hydroxyisourate hydrolase [Chloroflexota bacterium]|nr:hydroxyisourate hydrolase [Chloroflexota bacterium]